MKFNSLFKCLAIYLVVFYASAGIGYWLLRNHYQKNFSEVRMEEMISSVSSWRGKTDDPCLYEIFGDPVASEDSFVKVEIHCSREKRSINTISLKAVKADWTYKNIFKELAKINGFDPELLTSKEGNFKCFSDEGKINNFENQVKKMETLYCVGPEVNIEEIIKENFWKNEK